jgi:hypothetical protein
MKTKRRTFMMLAIAAVCIITIAPAQARPEPNPLNNVYFGEQHLHTTASADAYIQGNHKNDINDAFNYNKGKPVKKYLTGETVQRKTPYDWTAVTDHS